MITLEEVTKEWGNLAMRRVAEDLLRPNPLLEMLERNMPQPTRWQKITWPLRWRWQRVKDAYGVLTGRLEAHSE